jgi:hypothetical protein
MRTPPKKRPEPLPITDPVDRSSEMMLREKFGDRFDVLIARPISTIQRTMKEKGFTVIEACNYLRQSALDRDPGATATVMWLDAARSELMKGTVIHA